MNKLDLKNMDFCPPRKWLAVHRETGKNFIFTLSDVFNKYGKVCARHLGFLGDKSSDTPLYACDLYGFTGYCDSKGEEVYGGHVVKGEWAGLPTRQKYRVVCFHRSALALYDLIDKSYWFWNNWPNIQDHIKIIGHIHQPDSWSDEVRRLLE